MEKETRDLYVFGFGLALIIPYLVFFHSLSLQFSGLSVLILLSGFAFVLWLTTKVSTINPKINLWILIVHLFVFGKVIWLHPVSLSTVFMVISTLFLLTAVVDVNKLAPVYKVWMKGCHFIGQVITGLILSLMFYFVFAPIGIFFRMIKKDYLDRALDPQAQTYWHKRTQGILKKERYTQQF